MTDFGGGGDRGFSSGGEGDVGAGADSLELMEIPLSPTNYNQPPTPPDLPPPPSAFEAETAILAVLDKLRDESGYTKRSKYTEVEECYLKPLSRRWSLVNDKIPATATFEDKSTTMNLEMVEISGAQRYVVIMIDVKM